MAVAHRRSVPEAAQPGSTEYSFFLRPETTEGCHGVLAVTITPQSRQLSWTLPSLCSPNRGCILCKRLAIAFHALTAQPGTLTDWTILNASFERAAFRLWKHSSGYNGNRRRSDIIVCIPWKDNHSHTAGEALVGPVVRLFPCSGLDFSLLPVTPQYTPPLLGPFHPPSELRYFVERRVQSSGQRKENQISISFLAQEFRDWRRIELLFSGGIAGNINNVPHTHEDAIDEWNHSSHFQYVNDARELRQYSGAQDKWVFYNYYPQIMALLGEEPVEKETHRNSVASFGNPFEGEDDYSCNDSGIDIQSSQKDDRVERGLHDTFDDEPQSGMTDRPVRSSTMQGQRWSVDEMITISLLEALDSRSRANVGAVHRGKSPAKGRTPLRRMIAKVFRKFRLA